MPVYFGLFTFLLCNFHEMPPDMFNDTNFSPVTQGFETSEPSHCSVPLNFPTSPPELPVSAPLFGPSLFVPHSSSALRPEAIPVPEPEEASQIYTNPFFIQILLLLEVSRSCSTAATNQKLTPETLPPCWVEEC